jgi:hypothetical protein
MGIMKGRMNKLSLHSAEPKVRRFHWGAISVGVMIVVAFVVAPVIPGFFGTSVYVFGKYKGKPIEFYPGSDMEREVSGLSSEIPAGVEGLYRQFYYQQIFYMAFMRQAMRMAIEDRIKQSLLRISVERSNELVKGFAGFADFNGEFDLALYNRYTDEQKELIRNELEKSWLFSRYENDVINTPLSPRLFEWVQELAEKKIVLGWVRFSKEDFPLLELESFVQGQREILSSASANLLAFATRSEAENVYKQIESGSLSLEDISFSQREDFDSSLLYEILNLVQSSGYESLRNFLATGQEGEFTPVLALADGRHGFFLLSASPSFPDLEDAMIRNKIILYMQMNQEDLYQETLERVAASNFQNKTKTEDIVTLNPGGTTLYSPELGGLALFAGYVPFYTTVFRLGVGEWSRPFLFGDDVYVFQLVRREGEALTPARVQEALMNEKAQNLQQDLLNEKDFKNNFYEVYHSSGLVEGLQ